MVLSLLRLIPSLRRPPRARPREPRAAPATPCTSACEIEGARELNLAPPADDRPWCVWAPLLALALIGSVAMWTLVFRVPATAFVPAPRFRPFFVGGQSSAV